MSTDHLIRNLRRYTDARCPARLASVAASELERLTLENQKLRAQLAGHRRTAERWKAEGKGTQRALAKLRAGVAAALGMKQ